MTLQTAEQFEENEQYEEAYEEYKNLYAKKPEDLSILERLGHLAMVLDKKDEAAEYYTKMLEFDATNTLCYEQLMDIYVTTDKYKYYVCRGNMHNVTHQYEHAINDFKKALNHVDDDHQKACSTRFVLGTLYEQTGNPTRAIDEYLKVLDFEHKPQDAYIRLANLYVQEDAVPSAVETLERAIKEGFDTDSIRENLANLYLKNNQPQKAGEITKDELTKIKCLLTEGKTTEAIERLNKSEEKYKNTPKFYALKAEYYYLEKDFDKALAAVEQYDKFQPNTALAYQMKALIYEGKNDEFNSYLNWGKYNLVRGNKDIAINEFLNAYQIKEDDVNLVNTIAILLEQSGDKNHAFEFYEKLHKLEPENKTALQKLADFRESIGDDRMEAEYLEKLVQLDKRNANAIKRLAKLYEKLRDKENAIKYYEKYLSFTPQSEETEQIRRKLNKLENSEMVQEEGLIDKIMRFFNK